MVQFANKNITQCDVRENNSIQKKEKHTDYLKIINQYRNAKSKEKSPTEYLKLKRKSAQYTQ